MKTDQRVVRKWKASFASAGRWLLCNYMQRFPSFKYITSKEFIGPVRTCKTQSSPNLHVSPE